MTPPSRATPTAPEGRPDRTSSGRVVLKFGGTSVSGAEQWDRVAALVAERRAAGERPFLVLSAFAGVTTLLERALTAAVAGDGGAETDALRRLHADQAERIGAGELEEVEEELARVADALRGVALLGEATPRVRAGVLAAGELMSTRLGVRALRARGVEASWLDARDHLVCAGAAPAGEGTPSRWSHYLAATCPAGPDAPLRARVDEEQAVLVTQGFVARDGRGDTVVLGRGGSDTSAALFAVALDASRLEIWTDVPGMFTADPALVPTARLLRRLSHREAQEIATTGSRVLHPRCLPALRQADIPVHIRSTLHPDSDGTQILRAHRPHLPQLKAVSVQRDVTLVSLEAVDMWQEVGFLARLFEVFRDEGLSVDLVSTSETNVTVTLDPQGDLTAEPTLDRLVARLGALGEVRLLRGCAAVSLVGNDVRAQLHRLGPVFEAFEEHRVHLVSQAANDLNLTVVVDGDRAEAVVLEVHHHLIGQAVDPEVFGPRWGEAVAARGAPGPPVGEGTWWRRRRPELLAIAEREGSAYVYDLATVRRRAAELAALASVDRVFYAMKANGHPELLRAVRAEGLGIECVSLGEIEHVFATLPDLPPSDVLFTPNFAPRGEYERALELGVRLTLDSLYPLRHWPEVFRGRDVMIRMDPGRGRGHHPNVRTAGGHTKFGVPLFEVGEMRSLVERVGCRVTGLHLHAGSGVTDEAHWSEAAELLFRLSDELGGVEAVDVGGGLGVPARPGDAEIDLQRLDALLQPWRSRRPEEIWLEPGRYLVADAGVLVTRVTQTKGKGEHRYVGVETGMNSLLRPALYGSYHEILNLTRLDEPAREIVTVVGPICESTDRLGADRALPVTEEGDVLVLLHAGAYGRVMASEYNRRPPAVEHVL